MVYFLGNNKGPNATYELAISNG